MTDLSLKGALLAGLDDAQKATLRSALLKAFNSPDLDSVDKDAAQKLRGFAASMPVGDEGIIAASKILSEASFGNVAVDQSSYTIEFNGDDPSFWDRTTEIMKREGFAIIRDYLSGEDISEVREAVDRAERKYSSHLGHRKNAETKEFFFLGDPSTAPMKGYKGIAEHPGSVVVARQQAHENGAVDTFNIDYLDPALEDFAAQRLRHPAMVDAISRAFGNSYAPANLNYYLNDNIDKDGFITRDFHFDNVIMAKNFLYLTDVPDITYGPYTFIPRTHNFSALHRVNQMVSESTGWFKSDTKIIDRSTAVPCIAKAGTLIVSSQAGVHRGVTQRPGRRRALLTQAFFHAGHKNAPKLNRPTR